MIRMFQRHGVALLFFAGFSVASHGSEESFNAFMELTSGLNSNVFQRGASDAVVAGQSQSYAEDVQSQLVLSAGYKFLSESNMDMKLVGDFLFEKLSKNEIDAHSAGLAFPFSYYGEEYRLQFTPSVANLSVLGDKVLSFAGAATEYTYKFGRYRSKVYYRYTFSRVQDDRYQAYSGNMQDLHFGFSGHWLTQEYAVAVGRTANNYAETLDGNASYSGFFGNASYAFNGPRFGSVFSLRVDNTNYVQDPLDGSKRDDLTLKVEFTPSYRVHKRVQVFSRNAFIQNFSARTQVGGDDGYSQLVSLIGVNWAL